MPKVSDSEDQTQAIVTTKRTELREAHDGDMPDWRSLLKRSFKDDDSTGKVIKCVPNMTVIMAHQSAWKGVVGFDEFRNEALLLRPYPARAVEASGVRVDEPRAWNSTDCTVVAAWFGEALGWEPGPDMVHRAFASAALLNRYHPVRDYLNGLEWDGISRLDGFFQAYFGTHCEDDRERQYLHAVASKWLVSAVARVMRPGCKADAVLVLEGKQGVGKSTALRVLGGEWFSDAPIAIGDKDGVLALCGEWLVEFGEFASVNRKDLESVKQFITTQADSIRRPYEKTNETIKRQCVFAATTNKPKYLVDETGNRRFWPIKCQKIELEALERDRDQIWAEAVSLFKSGATWHVDSAELQKVFEEVQASRVEADAWFDDVAAWLEKKELLNQHTTEHLVTVSGVAKACLSIETAKQNTQDKKRIERILALCGYECENYRRRVNGVRGFYWRKVAE